MLAPGTEIAGYRVERVLGRGGMGVVYEATQLSLDRTVALKVIAGELGADPEFRERFRREGRLQAALDHPHIVTVHEAGESPLGLFLAMRLVRGPTLKDLIAEGPLEPARVAALLGPVADALDTAHEAGLVHRDIKPGNVLVGARDHAFLADFGLTRPVEPGATLTRTGQFVGTPHYLAPEQIRGEGATALSDVYAFAAMLFQCLTGTLPFDRTPEAAILFAHVQDPRPAVTARRPGLPPALDAVVARGMARDPADRPATARALMGEVHDALTGGAATRPYSAPRIAAAATQPAAAPGPAVPRRRRRRGPRLAAGAVVAAAAAGAAALALSGGSGDGGADAVLGSALASTAEPAPCSGGGPEACTIAQSALPGRRLAAPFAGVITRWRVKGASGRIRLVVLRADRRAVVGRSAPETARGSDVQAYSTRLAIARGQWIALEVEEGARPGLNLEAPGSSYERWFPPLGATSTAPSDESEAGQLMVAADLARD